MEYPDAFVQRGLALEGLADWDGAIADYSQVPPLPPRRLLRALLRCVSCCAPVCIASPALRFLLRVCLFALQLLLVYPCASLAVSRQRARPPQAIKLWGGGRGEGINPFVMTFRANALARTGRYEDALPVPPPSY
jgi:hypothetical protein